MAGALLNGKEMLKRVEALCEKQVVYATTGKALTFPVDSLCVHGDNAESVAHIKEIKNLMSQYEN
jgi:UPF0271 protein